MSVDTDKNRSVQRRMLPAILSGAHTHHSASGTNVHIVRRDGKFLARGRFQEQQFGETLGVTEQEAAPKLRKLLYELDQGHYVPPSQRTRQVFPIHVMKIPFSDVINRYLADRRKTKGKQTSGDYRSRLAWVIRFWEQPSNQKRFPFISNIDRQFCVNFKAYLHAQQTTRNGRSGGEPTPLSERQIYNIMDSFSSMLHWAGRPEIRLVPSDWVFPLSDELVGKKPTKAALREILLPVNERLELLEHMDLWQLTHLCLFMVLALRPEQAQGLLIGDVILSKRWLQFGTRLGGADFTKGKTEFVLPYPIELEPLLQFCIAGRESGPLFLSRLKSRKQKHIDKSVDVEALLATRLAQANVSDIATAHDRKDVFRELLVELGGVSTDELSREMNRVLESAGLRQGRSLKTFREAVSEDMKQCGMNHLDLSYLTGHTVADIMNEYTSVKPDKAMALYFESIRPLLNAIENRARVLGISRACSATTPTEQSINDNFTGAQVVHNWCTTDVIPNVRTIHQAMEAQSAIRTDLCGKTEESASRNGSKYGSGEVK